MLKLLNALPCCLYLNVHLPASLEYKSKSVVTFICPTLDKQLLQCEVHSYCKKSHKNTEIDLKSHKPMVEVCLPHWV